ncbi:hypothetical protein EI94DRAFT_1742661, partial [Lactarius quietus]
LTSAQASVKQNVPMYPDWEFAGCRSDSNPNRSIRALSTEVTVPGGLKNASVENCIGECKSLKFDVAGLNQQTCWCSHVGLNALTPGSGSEQMAISNCHTPCTGIPMSTEVEMALSSYTLFRNQARLVSES